MSLVEMPQDAELVDDVDLSALSLDELAARANAEHALVEAEAEAARERISAGLLHAIKSGAALLEVKERLGSGEFDPWLESNWAGSKTMAKCYCRWAYYKEEILSAPMDVSTSNVGAIVVGLPPIPTNGYRVPQEKIDQMKQLRAEGMPYRAIAEIVGVGAQSVSYHIEPGAKAKRIAENKRWKRRQAAARKALDQQEREREIRKAGGNISAAYSYVRKAAAELDAALGDAASPEVRQALRAALAGVHKAEDEIGKAVRHG